MDIRQLEAFVCVVKQNSFSKAADIIFLSQPTISAYIRALEKELGVQLLVRSTKEVYPTKAGKDIFKYAQNILSLRDEAIHSVSRIDQNVKGEIDILASTVPAHYLLPEIIADFQKKYPHIIFRIHQGSSQYVIERLSNFPHDFGLVGMKINNNRFTFTPICSDTLVLILPNNMPVGKELTKPELIQLLTTKPFVIREQGSGTRMEMEMLLAKYRLSIGDLQTIAYFNDTQGVIQSVSIGMGISIISKIAASTYHKLGLIKMIEIDSGSLNREFYMMLEKEMILSPVQNLFINYLTKYYHRER